VVPSKPLSQLLTWDGGNKTKESPVEDKKDRRVFTIKENIYGRNNPNAEIFTVDTEEGATDEDNMCSMIGDATMHHLDKLSPSQRQCWEHYVVMGGRALFDFIDSPLNNDRDPHGLKVEDIDNYYSNKPELLKHKDWMDEVLQEEQDRREKSEDVFVKGEAIPYQDWQDNPGLLKHFDTPSTPKNISIYCGNTDQIFYDDFSWYESDKVPGHPDSKVISDYLAKVNRDHDDLTEKYGEWLKEWLDKQEYKFPFVHKILELLTTRLVEGQKNPEETTKLALSLIDQDWQKAWMHQAKIQMAEDPVRQLLERKTEEWDQMAHEGITVLPLVKAFGQVLYTKFRSSVKRSHWAMYRAMKSRYCVPVIVRGIDINSCRLGDLERVLGVPRAIAVDIFTNRPFTSSAELMEREIEQKALILKDKEGKEYTITPAKKIKKGWLKKDLLSERGNIEELYQLVKDRAEAALSNRSMKALTSLSSELVTRQKDSRDNFSSKEWNALWSFYRTTKSDILDSMKGSPNE
jgi:hypothetical protein